MMEHMIQHSDQKKVDPDLETLIFYVNTSGLVMSRLQQKMVQAKEHFNQHMPNYNVVVVPSSTKDGFYSIDKLLDKMNVILVDYSPDEDSIDEFVENLKILACHIPNTMLIHKFEPLHVVSDDGGDTRISETVERYYPNQLPLWDKENADEEMLDFAYRMGATCMIMGTDTDKMVESEKKYRDKGLPIMKIALN